MSLFGDSLFGDEVGRVESPAPAPRKRTSTRARAHAGPDSSVVEVVVDVPALPRTLHYLEPAGLGRPLAVGDLVRVPLNGRRVRGWVSAVGVDPEVDRELESVAKLTGHALDGEVLGLCRWVARRWAGRLPTVLSAATPDRAVRSVSTASPRHPDPRRLPDLDTELSELAVECARRGAGVHQVTVSPSSDPASLVCALASVGQTLALVPAPAEARRIAGLLRRAGGSVAQWPGATAEALAGHSVVGGRGAVFAPAPALGSIVVIDEHDESLQNESSPTWHAREVAIERARRAGVPCVVLSPMPSLEALGAASRGQGGSQLSVTARSRREGWTPPVVVDRREDDPRTGLFSPRLVAEIRSARDRGEPVLCILNRVGRARLLSCRSCGSLAECEACGAAVRSEGERLACPRCGTERPVICLECGSTAMKVLRMGVTKAREDLEALLREPVAEVTAATVESQPTGDGSSGPGGVTIGTVAALHRALDLRGRRPPALVAFVDFDQELLATRYRASEEALALLLAASRVLGGRGSGRTLLVQTRSPDHAVIQSATRADPSVLARQELPRRELLGLPPAAAVAAVGGEAAEEWVRRLGSSPHAGNLEVVGPRDGWWLVRAEEPSVLADAAGSVERPKGRLRLRVDPMSLPV